MAPARARRLWSRPLGNALGVWVCSSKNTHKHPASGVLGLERQAQRLGWSQVGHARVAGVQAPGGAGGSGNSSSPSCFLLRLAGPCCADTGTSTSGSGVCPSPALLWPPSSLTTRWGFSSSFVRQTWVACSPREGEQSRGAVAVRAGSWQGVPAPVGLQRRGPHGRGVPRPLVVSSGATPT